MSIKNNFTIVIVTFKSEKVIETCLNSIDQKYTIIIVENSSNVKKNFGFFHKNNFSKIDDHPFKVDYVDGFSMLINKSRFKKNIFFDENIFMYLENTDLCKRTLENNESIYVIPKSQIIHFGAKAVNDEFSNEVEFSRNWHWMWSTFYFNKKHYGYFIALKKTYTKLITSILKFLFFTFIFNPVKKKIYLMRFLGLYNSIIGNKSWYRAKIK